MRPKDIASKIKTARKAARLRQQDLALISGVHRSFIVDLEAGKPTCELGKTLDVLRAVGLKIDIHGIDDGQS